MVCRVTELWLKFLGCACSNREETLVLCCWPWRNLSYQTFMSLQSFGFISILVPNRALCSKFADLFRRSFGCQAPLLLNQIPVLFLRQKASLLFRQGLKLSSFYKAYSLSGPGYFLILQYLFIHPQSLCSLCCFSS